MDRTLRFGVIGYGEVGKILTRALRERGASWVGAWDILFRDPKQAAEMKAHAQSALVECCEDRQRSRFRAVDGHGNGGKAGLVGGTGRQRLIQGSRARIGLAGIRGPGSR